MRVPRLYPNFSYHCQDNPEGLLRFKVVQKPPGIVEIVDHTTYEVCVFHVYDRQAFRLGNTHYSVTGITRVVIFNGNV